MEASQSTQKDGQWDILLSFNGIISFEIFMSIEDVLEKCSVDTPTKKLVIAWMD
jgi:hypothetical protein